MNLPPSPAEDKPSPRRSRAISLPRLLSSSGAAFWLIDVDGKIVHVSAAMRDWLGIEDEVPEMVGKALVPRAIEWRAGDVSRGHLTHRLHVPIDTVGVDGSVAGVNSLVRSVVAHFVRLESWPIGNETIATSPNGSLILGCLGEHIANVDVPWRAWFGEQGVRESARVEEEIAKFRGQAGRNANLLLAGNGSASRQFRSRVELACRIRCHLALIGGAGCGASQLASLIHHGIAPEEPWVCLDGSLMDVELLEVYAGPVISDLRENVVPRGTLCLERIDEMPLDAQSRLIQWTEIWPERLRLIGMRNGQGSDLVAIERGDEGASSNSLDEKLADLMAILPIVIPNLTDRRDDFELLASGLLASKRLSREVLDLLRAYPWPGEWEEFQAAMRFAKETASGDRIGREHLPLAIRSYRVAVRAGVEISRSESEVTIGPASVSTRDFQLESLDETVRKYEAELIGQAMAAAKGNKAEAARRLGISRTRLLRKLDEN